MLSSRYVCACVCMPMYGCRLAMGVHMSMCMYVCVHIGDNAEVNKGTVKQWGNLPSKVGVGETDAGGENGIEELEELLEMEKAYEEVSWLQDW